MFSKTEYFEWKNHPVTRQLFKELHADLHEITELWQGGGFLGDAVQNAKHVGMVYGIRCVLEYSPELIEENAA